MKEKDFLKYCNQYLEELSQIIEKMDINSNLDIEYTDGIIKITIDEIRQSFVINRHSASQKIWYSSPFSAVDYFSFIDGNWINNKQQNLQNKLLIELEKWLG
jgi:iron donor protein CyaY